MREKKRVFCLYRVSTMQQVDQQTSEGSIDDIPMQRRICEEFCAQMSWEIVDSLTEKGVSGYTTPIADRDAITEIRKAAMQKKFDILLVYMFDRLGRRADEIPFIVQWFIENGIEVWSATEGQQEMKHHADKLINYVRFWQAQGESEKTSLRVKTSHAQLIKDGCFRGGVAPFGYKLEHRGRINKKGIHICDLVINEQEAKVVIVIFDRFLVHGYGTQQIATYLANNGMTTRKGDRFTNTTILNMLKRSLYAGILSAGGVQSDVISELQIISLSDFNRVQEIIKENAARYARKHTTPSVKSNSLLSGIIFCGHCNGRMHLTTNGKMKLRKEDSAMVPRYRYVCYNRTRYTGRCNGQTGYGASTLDNLVDTIVISIFARLNEQPDEKTISAQLEKRVADYTLSLEQAKTTLNDEQQSLATLGDEVIKVIQGKSEYDPMTLNTMYSRMSESITAKEEIVKSIELKLANSQEILQQAKDWHSEVMTWASMYSNSPIDVKKMVVSQLISAIRVSRGYKMEIEFKISEQQLGLDYSFDYDKS